MYERMLNKQEMPSLEEINTDGVSPLKRKTS